MIADLPGGTPSRDVAVAVLEADLARLAPYLERPEEHHRELVEIRKAVEVRREAVLSDLPGGNSPTLRYVHEAGSGWTTGFVTYAKAINRHSKPPSGESARRPAGSDQQLPAAVTDRVIRDMVTRCRAEGP